MTTLAKPDGDGLAHGSPGRAAAAMRRDIGVVGLLFAGVGSIIGSGWLFGALNASQIAGPAAIFSWAIGALMILLIGLCFAELGAMFPLTGGVIRFPHLSFGSFASYTMGWINWVAAATVAPIEVEGALQYGTKYADFTTKHMPKGASEPVYTLTALGYGVAVIAMAFFVVVNYYGVRWFARDQQRRGVVEAGRDHPRDLRVPAHRVPRRQLHQPRLQQRRHARHAHGHRDRRHHVLVPRVPAGRRARRRVEQPEAQRPDRRHRLGAGDRV